jgi:molybdopterin-guanine dinucleotide biosynthesis protein A
VTPPLAAIILAGGRSSRMQGADKIFSTLGHGETLLDRAIGRLAPQVGTLAINANGDPARFAGRGLEVIADAVPDFQGPLAGILAGLDWAGSISAERLLTVAGDTPFFPPDLAGRLSRVAEGDIALAASGGRMHPVFALWPVGLAASLRDHLERDERRSVMSFIERHSFAAVDFPFVDMPGGKADPFFNVNTPDDLAEARRLLQNDPA